MQDKLIDKMKKINVAIIAHDRMKKALLIGLE